MCCNSHRWPLDNTLSSIPVHLQLTERDLVATKLDPKEVFTIICSCFTFSKPLACLVLELLLSPQVDKNLKKDSEENLMEFSQKQIRSRTKKTVNQLYRQMLQPVEVGVR